MLKFLPVNRRAASPVNAVVMMALLTLLLLITGPVAAQRPDYPYQLPTSINYNLNDVMSAWNEWKADHVTTVNAGPAPRQRVMGGVSINSTVSEGQAYGMLFAVIFGEQQLFDGLWLFAADHLNGNGLMHWHIGGYRQIWGSGAATDADVDYAMALVNACAKVSNGTWPPSSNGLNYCSLANNVIDAIWRTEVDHPGPGPSGGLDNNRGYELLPGDSWNPKAEYPEGIVNLSYFAPGYFRVFADFTGNNDWLRVVERNYEIIDAAQSKSNNCSGLVSNWNQYDGDPYEVSWYGADRSTQWGYDAARLAWRVATDQHWFGAPDATETMNEIGGFFLSVGVNNIQAEYRMNGNVVSWYRNGFFMGNAASAIWAAPQPQAINCGQANGSLNGTPQQAYDALVNVQRASRDYYSNAWRLLSMLLITGNFPNLHNGGTVTPIPPTSSPEPGVDPTATHTPTPVPPTATSSSPSQPPEAGVLDLQIKREGGVNAQQAQFRYRLTNNSGSPQSNISLRFYFTPDNGRGANDYVLDVYWTQSSATVSRTGGANPYFTINYGTATLQPGQTWEFTGSLHLNNWAAMNISNDWWATSGFEAEYSSTNSVTVYINGSLVSGQEPGGGSSGPLNPTATFTPTPTNTPVSPTATHTPTSTSTPVPPTPTNTPVAPPATATSTPVPPTPTFTNTPVPPTPTFTNTPVPLPPTLTPTPVPPVVQPPTAGGSFGLTIKREGSDDSSMSGYRARLTNTGSSPQRNIQVRFYFTPDGSRAAADYILESYWSQVPAAVSGVMTDANGRTYFALDFGPAALGPGQTWEFVGSIHLTDWGREYSSANDWWRSGGLQPDYAPTNTIPVFVNGALSYGMTP